MLKPITLRTNHPLFERTTITATVNHSDNPDSEQQTLPCEAEEREERQTHSSRTFAQINQETLSLPWFQKTRTLDLEISTLPAYIDATKLIEPF
jgi:hypothetical protein